ncbi:hypothetical protein COCCU_08375 [Corynebacterium occultum]|uniref:Uncharacterized protein n=1 Tax=Corynebacterium occultum TaxID=2675219 RepID=A0A6B8VWY4_9CORY|nr:hypothetical protein [Corynebacterium occultum]QGU07599.1 hypothetical protein COCCU_08375 [Corynebacterium occultum]
MTQPPNQNPYGENPDGNNREENQRNQDNSGSAFPPYPSTPHPEDQPQGGYPGQGADGGALPGYQGYGAQSYGSQPQQGYPSYGNYGQPGYNEYAQQGYPQYGQPGDPELVRGDGRVDIMMAVRFGFKATFSNALIWLLGTLIFFIAIIALSIVSSLIAIDPSSPTGINPTMMDISSFLISAVALVISVFIYTGALRQVDKPKIRISDFWENLHFWPTLGVAVLVALIGGLIGGGISALIMGPGMMDPTTVGPEEIAGMFGGLALMLLVMILISPLTSFMVWYAADGREGVFGAIKCGFRDAARNYLLLLAFMVVTGILIIVAAVITFGLVLLILMPVYMLALAHIYRQIAGEPYQIIR